MIVGVVGVPIGVALIVLNVRRAIRYDDSFGAIPQVVPDDRDRGGARCRFNRVARGIHRYGGSLVGCLAGVGFVIGGFLALG